jgi:hypothetical protein
MCYPTTRYRLDRISLDIRCYPANAGLAHQSDEVAQQAATDRFRAAVRRARRHGGVHRAPPTAPDRETHRAVPVAATRSHRPMSGVRGAWRAHGPSGTSFWENAVASEQRAVPLEDLDLYRHVVNHCSGSGFAKSVASTSSPRSTTAPPAMDARWVLALASSDLLRSSALRQCRLSKAAAGAPGAGRPGAGPLAGMDPPRWRRTAGRPRGLVPAGRYRQRRS